MQTELSVNVNAIAFLRNRRGLSWPSVVELSRIALEAGAKGITVHPRPDARHITAQDVYDLSKLLSADIFADKEFNIEGYPDERFLSLVEEVRPNQVTFVPDEPSQVTSDHGWAIDENADLLESAIHRTKAQSARVSLFIDANSSLPEKARAIGADRVELFTGPYGAEEADEEARHKALAALAETADVAYKIGLGVNAGHDLTVQNVPDLVKAAPMIAELSIGHGLTADALKYGMEQTVKRFLKVCGQ